MKKTKFGKIPLVFPIPIVLAGATVQGKPNYATLGDCGVMGINPPLVCVSLHREHHTTTGITEHRTFSVNFPSTELLAVTDYCGMVSGKDVDKSGLFESFYGELGTAPMIRECPVNLECRVVKDLRIEHRQIFVGEVVEAYVDSDHVVEREKGPSIADVARLDPIIYGLDNRYYSIGRAIGTGYSEGKRLMEEGPEK